MFSNIMIFALQTKMLKNCLCRVSASVRSWKNIHICSTEFSAEQVKRSRRNFQNTKLLREIEDYFSTSPTFMSEKAHLNPRLLDDKAKSDLYLCNEKSAYNIVDSLKIHGALHNGIILEFNPGFGFITKQLLLSNIPAINVFEKDDYFRKTLTQLQLEYPDQIYIYNMNLLNFINMFYVDKFKGVICNKEVIEKIELKDWCDEPYIKIVGAFTEKKFLRTLLMNIVFQEGLITYGRPQLFVLMDPKLYCTIAPINSLVTPFSVLCRIFFDVELLLTVNRKDYLPWSKVTTKKYAKVQFKSLDFNQLHLVKITPKRDLLDKIGGVKNLKPLWFFARQLCKSGKRRVIPEIEKWVPGCGYRLIAVNVDAFTIFEDLSSEELLQVFLEFIEWPEYNKSSFAHAMETYLSKQTEEAEVSEVGKAFDEMHENDSDTEQLRNSSQLPGDA